MELYNAIFYRRSVKNYSNKNVNTPLMDEVKEICNDITYLNEELKIKAHIIERGHLIHFLMDKKCRIKAPHYIVVTSNQGEDYLENIGFAMEKVVLELTTLGLATTWIDYNLKKEDMEEFIRVENNEIEYGELVEKEELEAENEQVVEDIEKPYAIIAFGYPEKQERLFNSIEELPKKKRKNINQISKKVDKKWNKAIDAARLAPSINNCQPWMFYSKNNIINIYKENQKKSINDMAKISMGIALRHFDIACEKYGINVKYEKIKPKNKLGKKYYISVIETS